MLPNTEARTVRTMTESRQSETVPGRSADSSSSAEAQASAVACAYLERTLQGRKNRAYEVFAFIAGDTRDRSLRGQPTQYTASNLQAAVSPDAAKEPSGWLSPLWAKLLNDEPGWQEGLADTARSLGLQFVPKLQKTPGSPAQYWLEPVPLPASGVEERDAAHVEVPPGGIRYTPAAVRAPGAWLASALRGGILRWTRTFRISLLVAVIAALVLVLGLIWLGVMIGIRSARPLTLQDVFLLGGLLVVCWMTVRVFRFLDELFDLRIVIAPSLLTPINEDRVTLELRRANSSDEVGELAFVRYTATCAKCSGQVDIHAGGQEFQGRLIGRCRRSAREHVYSFDPVLRVGVPQR